MQFVWFWTFWHWSKESHQEGLLLLNPLHGIAGNWDEWYRHEASVTDLWRIDAAGRSERDQRAFVRWLHRCWLREIGTDGNRLVGRFVLTQLAQVSPFAEWSTFQPFRSGYRVGGISAVILSEESRGRADDVRSLEGMVIPGFGTAPAVMSEGFQADKADLEIPRRAARHMLRGRGLLTLLAWWVVQGRRPGPGWARGLRAAGWCGVAALIGYLWFVPEPGARLWLICAILMLVWSVLVVAAAGGASRVCFDAWRGGRRWCNVLEKSQVRFRMTAGLTVHGGSAGLAFCLNTLLATYRAHPEFARRSWLWRNIFAGLKARRCELAATGVVAAEGWIGQVVLEPKLRACLEHGDIAQLVTPRQQEASRFAAPVGQVKRRIFQRSHATDWKPGFAAERSQLSQHPGKHVAEVLIAIGGLGSRAQLVGNLLSLGISAVMLFALPDLRNILMPPRPPAAVAPSSSSPYALWVSIDTRQPGCFRAVFESPAWANRLANFERQGSDAPARAEIPLRRLTQRSSRDEEHGTVWIERRRRFLHREYFPGERVGHFTMPYLNRLAP